MERLQRWPERPRPVWGIRRNPYVRVERILRDTSNLPCPVRFSFGDRTLRGHANVIRNGGEVVGWVVVWEDATDDLVRIRNAEDDACDARAVQQVMGALFQATSAEDALQTALDTVRASYGWTYGSYWSIKPGERQLTFVIESGTIGDEFRRVTQTASFAEGVGLSGRAWRQRDVVFVPDLAQVTDCVRAPAASRAGVKSGFCMPITLDGALVGTMDFFALDEQQPSTGRLETLRRVGQLVGQTLDRLLTQQRDRERAAEIESTATALAAAAEELQRVSSEIGDNAATTSSSVCEIARTSTEVSEHIDTVATGAEEMTASIKEIARNATNAAGVAAHAVDAVRETSATIGKLGESSAEIGQIVKLITGIAQQTNLLALNATIEAARAGESGKGFAVVAGEVKELAKATARATEDISTKIEAIQTDTRLSVEAIASIRGIIEQISSFQDTIASAVEEQAATTSEMARAVTAAGDGAGHIATSLQSVRDRAEGTASGSAASHSAATDLAKMAAALESLIH